jgi:hypothetical protein
LATVAEDLARLRPAATQVQHRDLGLGQAAVGIEGLDTGLDEVQRVGDDAAGQRHLQHDEAGGDPVAAQRRQDGPQVGEVARHVSSLHG